MKRLICEGSSDDTFGVYGDGISEDYDNCANGKPIYFALESPSTGESVVIAGQYAPGPCNGWLIGIAPTEDDQERHIAPWPMSFTRTNREYSPGLVIEAPDDVTVEHIQPSEAR